MRDEWKCFRAGIGDRLVLGPRDLYKITAFPACNNGQWELRCEDASGRMCVIDMCSNAILARKGAGLVADIGKHIYYIGPTIFKCEHAWEFNELGKVCGPLQYWQSDQMNRKDRWVLQVQFPEFCEWCDVADLSYEMGKLRKGLKVDQQVLVNGRMGWITGPGVYDEVRVFFWDGEEADFGADQLEVVA